ncbi:(deoxy)nucleoside triphosphate pyrophosphohydrolase [Daejeonella sp.]|uniref:(deoxy)nucleoside triphosphate pyrophosphohydrolase n=1 Tax=Daejeonella sp. TaxID=2805397 RepID=UPI003784DFAB
MLLVACAIILNSQNKVIVCQRSTSMHLPLKWEFPGGKVELNEKPEECLIREIKEELDIKISVIKQLSINDHHYLDKSIRLIPFICRYLSGEINLKEHVDFKYLDKENLLDLDWAEADLPILKEYLCLS